MGTKLSNYLRVIEKIIAIAGNKEEALNEIEGKLQGEIGLSVRLKNNHES